MFRGFIITKEALRIELESDFARVAERARGVRPGDRRARVAPTAMPIRLMASESPSRAAAAVSRTLFRAPATASAAAAFVFATMAAGCNCS